MILHDFETALTFGKLKGKTIADVLINHPTYIEWYYSELDDFYITDSLWASLDCTIDFKNMSQKDKIESKDVLLVIEQNKELHKEKRKRYKRHMLEKFEKKIEVYLKGTLNGCI
jgi:hypothetical protein